MYAAAVLPSTAARLSGCCLPAHGALCHAVVRTEAIDAALDAFAEVSAELAVRAARLFDDAVARQ
eukprot:COSAG01_NODE_27667_length_680_cov_0.716007_1_plen_64_part_10